MRSSTNYVRTYVRTTVGERPGDKSDGLVVQFDNQRTYVRTCVRTVVQYCTYVRNSLWRHDNQEPELW